MSEDETKNESLAPDISIVVPMHNEEGNVERLWEEVDAVIPDLEGSVEIILVNDGSTDRTGELLRSLAEKDPRVRAVELDGNWGQAAAFCAGFEVARGAVILTMDGDLQNDPADFPKSLAKLREGFKAVTGWRKDRHERYWDRVLPSKIANWLIGVVTKVPIHDNGCGLKSYQAEVVKGKYLPRGFNRFMPSIFGVKADEVAEIPVNDRERFAGSTHYGLKRIFIVLKDLLALRATMAAYPNRELTLYTTARTFGIMLSLAIAGVTIGGQGLWWAAGLVPAGILIFLSHLVCINISRFMKTQKTKGFKIREIVEREEVHVSPT
jgi:glycosyltransferase involved in cell wall biosynthesis